MKAQIKPRIDLENRTRLEEVIPLRTPFVIFVDPADTCKILNVSFVLLGIGVL
jgi:hypothetical protein